MTPPQPPSQTLRERIEEIVVWIDNKYPRAQFGDGNPNMVDVFHKLKAALDAQGASPQPCIHGEHCMMCAHIRAARRQEQT